MEPTSLYLFVSKEGQVKLTLTGCYCCTKPSDQISQIPRKNLTKEMQDSYNENYKATSERN